MGIVLSHNLLIWPSWTNTNVIQDVLSQKIGFDVTDADFYPYWKPNGVFIGKNPDIKISLYKKPNGSMFVTLFNASVSTGISAIDIRKGAMQGNYDIRMYDPLTRTSTPVSDITKFTTSIEGMSMKLLLCNKK